MVPDYYMFLLLLYWLFHMLSFQILFSPDMVYHYKLVV